MGIVAKSFSGRIVGLMKWFKDTAERIGFDKEKVLSLAFAIIFTAVVFLDSNYLNHMVLTGTWLFIGAFLSVVILAIMLVAGFAVYKAALHASVGFGVMIFLVQTYCDLETRTPQGMQALAFLWGMGLIYIVFEFGNKLQNAYKEHTKKIKGGEKKSWEARVLVGVYLLFVIMYLSMISQVLSPIIFDLCIYK